MEIRNTDSIASIDFADIRMSIDELEVITTPLAYTLDNLSDEEINLQFGATRDEIEEINQDISKTAISASTSAVSALKSATRRDRKDLRRAR